MTAVRHVNANPNILNSFKKTQTCQQIYQAMESSKLAKQEASAPGFL